MAYLSPEQARGDPVDARSDLYGLGATLYHALCGRPPFTGPDMGTILSQHLSAAPDAPSTHVPGIAPALDRLVLDLLAKDPGARPRTAGEAADLLLALETAGGGGEAELVGREPELRLLARVLERALAGSGGVLAVSGEAGIGKTALARRLVREAERRGALVAVGRCPEDSGAPAYWPWAQALRDLAGSATVAAPSELAPILDPSAAGPGAARDPDRARFALFDAVATYVLAVAGQTPVVLVLDDLHWADRSSLLLLEHLARELATAPLLVAVSYRDAEARRPGALRDTVAALARDPAFEPVAVRGLGEAGVVQLLAALGAAGTPDLGPAIHRHTGGNPFFVAEVARVLAAEGAPAGAAAVEVLPEGVRALVGRRIAGLAPAARELLGLAAVIGMRFTLDLVARVSGQERATALDALEEAAVAGLTVPVREPGQHAFAHAIVRAAVYAELTERRRGELHGAVARVLEQQPGGADVDALAHHHRAAALRGASPDPALHWCERAGARAATQLAHAEAAQRFEEALEALELGAEAAPRTLRRLLLQAARAHTSAGDLDQGRERFRRAASAAVAEDDPEDFTRAALGYAEWTDYGVVDREAIGLLEEALERLPDRDDALRALVLGRLAVRLEAATEQPRREALIDAAVAMARRLDDQEALATLLPLSVLVDWRPERTSERRAAAAESVALARRAGDPQMALWARIARFVDAFGDGDVPAADAELAAYDHLVSELRQPYYAWYGMVLRRDAQHLRRLARGGAPARRRRRDADPGARPGLRPGAHGPGRHAGPCPRRAARGRSRDVAGMRRPLSRDAALAGAGRGPRVVARAPRRRGAERRALRGRRLPGGARRRRPDRHARTARGGLRRAGRPARGAAARPAGAARGPQPPDRARLGGMGCGRSAARLPRGGLRPPRAGRGALRPRARAQPALGVGDLVGARGRGARGVARRSSGRGGRPAPRARGRGAVRPPWPRAAARRSPALVGRLLRRRLLVGRVAGQRDLPLPLRLGRRILDLPVLLEESRQQLRDGLLTCGRSPSLGGRSSS